MSLKYIIYILLFNFHITTTGVAQNEYSIKWIKQYPEEDTNNKVKINKRSISNLLFGKKDIKLEKPISLFAQNPDTFWVLDQSNGSIFGVENKEIKTPRFIKKKIKTFPSLVGICQIPNNKLLITDSYNNNIYFVDLKLKDIHIINDTLKLKRPTGIAFNPKKEEIWVVETGAHQISVLNIKGELVKTIGGRGSQPGKFNFPTDIWIDKRGDVYILDAMNFRIQIFDNNGVLKSYFGELGNATGFFARPKAIACDSRGNIYVTDALYHNVQIFNNKGEFLYYFGGQGKEKEKFWMPSGIYIDKNDYIYIADSYNSRIQVFQLIK